MRTVELFQFSYRSLSVPMQMILVRNIQQVVFYKDQIVMKALYENNPMIEYSKTFPYAKVHKTSDFITILEDILNRNGEQILTEDIINSIKQQL